MKEDIFKKRQGETVQLELFRTTYHFDKIDDYGEEATGKFSQDLLSKISPLKMTN